VKRGLLLTLTEPPPGMEQEFNARYDTEHFPERLAIPGFRSARRWVRGKSYLATCELDPAAALQSPAYLARYQNQTPWSRRCLRLEGVLQQRRFAADSGETIFLYELATAGQTDAYRLYKP
jgi:hypothetical protein